MNWDSFIQGFGWGGTVGALVAGWIVYDAMKKAMDNAINHFFDQLLEPDDGPITEPMEHQRSDAADSATSTASKSS